MTYYFVAIMLVGGHEEDRYPAKGDVFLNAIPLLYVGSGTVSLNRNA